MNKTHLYLLSACLCLLGISIFVYKAFVLKFPVIPDKQAQIWNIEARIQYTPDEGPAKVKLFIPKGNQLFSITDEEFISSGYGLDIRNKESNRQAIWTIRQATGEQVLYYKATVRPRTEPADKKPVIPALPEVQYIEAQRIAADAIISQAKHQSADEESFIREIILRLNKPVSRSGNDPVAILVPPQASIEQRLEVATQLLAIEKIPARIVNGVQLVDFDRNIKYVYWLEVYHRHEWQSYNAITGHMDIPSNYLPWWRGDKRVASIAGGKLVSIKTAVSRNDESALISALWRQHATRPVLYQLSLLALPLDTQNVYRVLLTVPLGVLLLVILRNVIGIRTFGTFMPVLIAMAFRETHLVWGVILFSLVVGMGLSIRFYLEKLKLLLVPRLASVLITVIILMLAISLFSHKLGIHPGLSVALFPMVILTMTIERMSIIWDERGAKESLRQGIGSLFVAVLAFLVMNIELLRYLLFIFPELLLIILAISLLLGRYSGYRLLELFRFKVLAKK